MSWKEKEIEKRYFTVHEVMLEIGTTYFDLMKRVRESGIKPKENFRGFKRFTSQQIERLKTV